MSKLHTHYDNLKVARNAPPEVIQAAYRALSLKHHPDHNPGDPEAARVMTLINAAYSVLSDPAKRAEHDQWIARREVELGLASPSSSAGAPGSSSGSSSGGAATNPFDARSTGQGARQQNTAGPGRAEYGPGSSRGAAGQQGQQGQQAGTGQTPPPGAAARKPRAGGHLGRYWFWYLIAALLVWKIWWTSAPKQEPQPPAAPQRPAASVSRRPAAKGAPAGPAASDIAAALEAASKAAASKDEASRDASAGERGSASDKRESGSGRCRVVLDNKQGGAALVGRLVRLENGKAEVVREFAVPARGATNVGGVQPGTYEVRYRNPSTGVTMKTETFTLREAQTPEGVKSDVLTLTTYNVSNGNMRTTPIGEGEY